MPNFTTGWYSVWVINLNHAIVKRSSFHFFDFISSSDCTILSREADLFPLQVYKSPFLVAFDDESESIVVAIRGTLSLEDAIVDMLIEGNHLVPDEIPPDVSAEDSTNFFVHMGMLSSARNLRDIILREQLIEKARVHRPNYPLVICGHSLGAGVASVLAFLLRKYYPEVKAYAYSPPLGLMRFVFLESCLLISFQ